MILSNVVVRGLSVGLVVVALAGCDSCIDEQVQRVASPDDTLEAVHIERNCHTTVPIVHGVYVVPKGQSPTAKQEVFNGDRTEGIVLRWSTPRDLAIEYTGGRVWRFTSYWWSADVLSPTDEVRITERRR